MKEVKNTQNHVGLALHIFCCCQAVLIVLKAKENWRVPKRISLQTRNLKQHEFHCFMIALVCSSIDRTFSTKVSKYSFPLVILIAMTCCAPFYQLSQFIIAVSSLAKPTMVHLNSVRTLMKILLGVLKHLEKMCD